MYCLAEDALGRPAKTMSIGTAHVVAELQALITLITVTALRQHTGSRMITSAALRHQTGRRPEM